MGTKIDTIVRFSPAEIPRILRFHYGADPKVPVHFSAEPSTVKSEGTRQFAIDQANEEGREFFEWNQRPLEDKKVALTEPGKYFVFADIRASETDIGELRLQNMNGEEYLTYKYALLFEVLSRKEAKGILFFDEMNLAPNMIKAQFYKIINDRAIGDLPISRGVLCVSAGNEAEHSRGVTEDPVPLVLRRGNYFLRPLSAEEYTDYAAKAGQHQWIIGYLGFQPGDVHKVAYDLPDSVGQPCPRMWTKLDAILKANPKLSMDDVEMVATGLIGQGAAKKFSAFVKSAKKIDLDALIRKPELIKEYEANSSEISLVYAIIAGVVDKWRTEKKVLKPAFEMALFFQRPEFGAFMLRSMKSVDEKAFMKAGSDTKLIDDALMKKVVERYAKFIFKEV